MVHLAILGGLALVSLATLPWAIAAALRQALDGSSAEEAGFLLSELNRQYRERGRQEKDVKQMLEDYARERGLVPAGAGESNEAKGSGS